MNIWKVILAIGTGAAVVAGGAYYLGIFDEPAAVTESSTPSETAGSGATDPADPPATENKSIVEADAVPPAFDLLRVEPSGDIVIAGSAAKGSSVEIVTGSTVIATTTADAGGQFVAVLDEPLKPGDYQIVLRSTTKEGVSATSPETAIVSVPETIAGEVLALVEQPGEASRLISKPKAKPATEEKTEPDPEPETANEQDNDPTAKAEQTASNGKNQQSPDEGGQNLKETEQKSAPENADVAAADATPEQAESPKPEAKQVAEAQQSATGEETGSEGNQTSKVAEEPTPSEARNKTQGEGTDPGAEKPSEITKAEEPAGDSSAMNPAFPSVVAVEAVEIDGTKIFVAGRGEPGRLVRIYANEELLGQAEVSAIGRFLLETDRELKVGDYIIRADMLEKNSGEVVSRAAVPFEREPGETMAAVAQQPTDTDSNNQSDTTDQDRKASGGSKDATGMPKSAEETKPAHTEASEQSDGSSENEGRSGNDIAKDNTSGSSTTETVGVNSEPESEGAGPNEAAANESPKEVATATQQTSEEKNQQKTANPNSGPVTSEKLQRVSSSVIIRRGDNLWRISRRVYGRGVRYTTIYLANEDQIEDPNRIWPGQVFTVPDETPEGEVADKTLLEERMAEEKAKEAETSAGN